jgi:hypothetical protein
MTAYLSRLLPGYGRPAGIHPRPRSRYEPDPHINLDYAPLDLDQKAEDIFEAPRPPHVVSTQRTDSGPGDGAVSPARPHRGKSVAPSPVTAPRSPVADRSSHEIRREQLSLGVSHAPARIDPADRRNAPPSPSPVSPSAETWAPDGRAEVSLRQTASIPPDSSRPVPRPPEAAFGESRSGQPDRPPPANIAGPRPDLTPTQRPSVGKGENSTPTGLPPGTGDYPSTTADFAAAPAATTALDMFRHRDEPTSFGPDLLADTDRPRTSRTLDPAIRQAIIDAVAEPSRAETTQVTVHIDRIDVHATASSAPPPPEHPRSRAAPTSLESYLRSRSRRSAR